MRAGTNLNCGDFYQKHTQVAYMCVTITMSVKSVYNSDVVIGNVQSPLGIYIYCCDLIREIS